MCSKLKITRKINYHIIKLIFNSPPSAHSKALILFFHQSMLEPAPLTLCYTQTLPQMSRSIETDLQVLNVNIHCCDVFLKVIMFYL